MTILIASLYALLETLMQLILEGAILIAQLMLNATVTVFTDGQNIFNTFSDLVFPADSNIPAIIKGVSYGIILLCIFLTTFKGFISPMTGDDEISPWQAVIRGVTTILITFIIFGFDFGGSVHYVGLISSIGEWFGTILSFVGGASDGFELSASSLLGAVKNPIAYIAELVLIISIMVGVFAATIQYLERIIAFAISYLIGPIAVALYANKETSDTTKQWAMSLFTQFIAILLSLILWNVFLIKLNEAFSVGLDFSGSTSIFNFGICIAILGIMKNSEKILNSFGLRTMQLGDAARAVTGGVAAIRSAAMLGMRGYQVFGKGHGGVGLKTTADAGVDSTSAPLYDSNGDINSNQNGFFGSGNIGGFVTSLKGGEYLREHRAEGSARLALSESENLPVRADDINTAFGWNESSNIQASGGAYGMMTPVSYKSDTFARESDGSIKFDEQGNAQYETVSGWMGDVQYRTGGNSVRLEDAVIVGKGANYTIRPGQSAGMGSNGNERVFTGDGPIITKNGQHIYKTKEIVQNTQPASVESSVETPIKADRKVVQTTRHKGNTEFNSNDKKAA